MDVLFVFREGMCFGALRVDATEREKEKEIERTSQGECYGVLDICQGTSVLFQLRWSVWRWSIAVEQMGVCISSGADRDGVEEIRMDCSADADGDGQ